MLSLFAFCRICFVAVANAELNNTVHLCSSQGCTVDFTPKTGPSCFAFCLCTCKSCCVQSQAEQYCTLVKQTHNRIAPSADHSFTNYWLKLPTFKAENVALHENGIEIYQKVNGDISCHPTAQENGVRRHTMSHNCFVIFTPV
jgi:hypothetical protein